MAKKISDLGTAAAIKGDELLELVQAGVNVKALAGALLPPGHIDGLKMLYASANALTVKSGAAFIQSLGRTVFAPADIALTGLTLAASTWYHLYLYLNGAVPAVEVVTTAPAAAFNGTARSKTGDASRRYVGSVLTDASAAIVPFVHLPAVAQVMYKSPLPSLRVLSAGAAITPTLVQCSAFVPTTALAITARFLNQGASGATLYVAGGDVTVSTSAGAVAIASGGTAFGPCPVDASQQLAYVNQATGGVSYIDITGYFYER